MKTAFVELNATKNEFYFNYDITYKQKYGYMKKGRDSYELAENDCTIPL